ncbi:MAG TPA: TROVE domain-containing protein [Phycisphaerae bacterium]|nr:TROVE domain-containing protein [Phycisphaerae bacterium]
MATTNLKRPATTLRTHEGAPAARIGAEAQLRRTLMACLLNEGEFYEDGVSIAVRIAEGVAAVPLEVAATLAIEAREQMHLRHAPLLVVREMARQGGSRVIGDTLARVIQRPDELAEFTALCLKTGMRKGLTPQVKRGLATAFRKFDEYALEKWNRDDREVRLRDVLFLSHAKPADEAQAALWKRLIDGTLATPDTWEVGLSAATDKKAEWERLIAEDRLGGLAVLRNLRNMEQAGVERDLIRTAIAQGNFRRVLPFRFIAAARYAPALEPELEAAMFRATAEMERLPGKTVLLVDHSGSMAAALSAKSDMTRFDAACGLAMLLREIAEDVEVVAFSAPLDSYYGGQMVQVGSRAVACGSGRPAVATVPPRRGFALRDVLEAATPWSGTHTEDGKRHCDALGYDRLIVITDEQSHQRISGPHGRGYFINVASARNGIGYGPWTHIDGWSEAVLRYIAEAEREGPEG